MAQATGKRGTVLVVDDSQDIRDLLCTRLRWTGYRCVEAATGEQAVELALETFPALILMDLGMPVMDGYEATRRIKALPGFGRIPIVAVSAFSESGKKHKALEAGCIECVSKPIDFGMFDNMVKRHLQSH